MCRNGARLIVSSHIGRIRGIKRVEKFNRDTLAF